MSHVILNDKLDAHNLSELEISKLYAFITRNYKSWRKKYPNLIGVRIGMKVTKSQLKSNYAIVFHVTKKRKKMLDEHKIPTHLKIKLDGKKFTRIETDVIETGRTMLHVKSGTKICNTSTKYNIGTAGVLLTNNHGIFILSNMHVLGSQYLGTSNRKSFYTNPNFDIAEFDGITLKNVASYSDGCVNSRIDAAIARVDPRIIPSNLINGKDLIGIKEVPDNVFSSHLQVAVAIPNPPYQKLTYIIAKNQISTFNYPFGENTFNSLITMSPKVTQKGDSGSAIYDPFSNRLIGIILGASTNSDYCYGIPIADILNYFELITY